MIFLKELLHSIGEEKESGLVNIDDWKWSDVDHLSNMGFNFDGDYKMKTNKPPIMTVYKKKDDGNGPEFFYLKEEPQESDYPQKKKKEIPLKRFKNFNELIEFFDTYEQPELDKNM